MTKFRVATTVGCLALMGGMVAPSARADPRDRKTTITFSGPVEIPGVHLAGWGVLPAGTYVFKILDSPANRHIVQISNKDDTTVYATILAIPNYRLKATDKTVITFSERPAGEPEALRAWFYPGRNWGEEFVYPKDKAVALAKASNAPVLFTPAEIPFEVSEPAKVADEPTLMELRRIPVMAISPTGDEIQLAQAVTPPATEPEQVAAANPTQGQARGETTLPNTASGLPLLFLFGFMALGGAVAVRAAATRLR